MKTTITASRLLWGRLSACGGLSVRLLHLLTSVSCLLTPAFSETGRDVRLRYAPVAQTARDELLKGIRGMTVPTEPAILSRSQESE